jgi:6-phosphogluconolactonase
MNHTGRGSAVWLTLAFTFTLPLTARATAGQAVYTMSNALTGNEVLVFTRKPNGNLDPAGAFPTGGTGTGGGLGNQGGLVLDPSDRWLFVINAGSGSISSFRLLEEGLQLVEAVPSGGFRPISLTVCGTLLYVLNEGDPTDPASADNITGFHIHGDGTLTLIPGATRSLSADKTSPARIGFNKEGTVLLVTEKATNRLTTYTVNPDGTPNAPLSHPAAFPRPFGFQFGDRDIVVVIHSNPDNAVASYPVNRETGEVSDALGTFAAELAACWVVLSSDQTIGYALNAGSASISLFSIKFDGSLAPFFRSGGEVGTGKSPSDLVLTQDGQRLYVLNSTDHTIRAFQVKADGRLSGGGTVPVPAGANSLAAL